MIPEWYLEIPFITIEYTDILNGTLASLNDTRMVFGNTIHYYFNTIQYH